MSPGRPITDPALKLFVRVRVRSLLEEAPSYDGWRVNHRQPHPGDYGTVVDILTAPNLPDKYVVESCLADGSCLWIADFLGEEIEVDEAAKA